MLPLTLLLAATGLGQTPAGKPSLQDCLQACPVLNDPAPFLRLPKITPVEECRIAETADKCSAKTWSHTFHTAARFNVPRFDQNQEPMEGDALVIYEGMKLTVNETTGVYDVSFTATVPTRPVTVRLQLVFKENPQGNAITITLPPIRLENDESLSPGDNSGKTLRVQHRGMSELFMHKTIESSDLTKPKFLGELPHPKFPINQTWQIQRKGSARFGSARVNDDQDR